MWSGLEGDLVSEDRQGNASSEANQPDESPVLDSEEEEEELSMDGKEPSMTRLPSLGWPIYSLLAEMDDKDDLGRLFLMVSGREKLTHYDRNEKESDGSLRRDWCVLVRGRSDKSALVPQKRKRPKDEHGQETMNDARSSDTDEMNTQARLASRV